jgi:hypothetical protein
VEGAAELDAVGALVGAPPPLFIIDGVGGAVVALIPVVFIIEGLLGATVAELDVMPGCMLAAPVGVGAGAVGIAVVAVDTIAPTPSSGLSDAPQLTIKTQELTSARRETGKLGRRRLILIVFSVEQGTVFGLLRFRAFEARLW